MQTFSLGVWNHTLTRAERPIFASLIAPRHNWAPAIVGSTVLHVALVACTLLAQSYLPLLRPDSLDALYVARMVPLRVPQKVYYFVERQDKTTDSGIEAAGRGPVAPRRAGLRLSPQVRIPLLPEPPRPSALLLQPSAELAQLVAPLPAITAWAPRERPAPKTFVQPGRARTSPERQTLDAPPSIDRPSLEPRASNLNFAPMRRIAAPALVLPPSSTVPVRILEAPPLASQVENAGIGREGGDPVNLVAAGLGDLPPNAYVTVPNGVAGAPAGGAPSGPAQARADAGERSSNPGDSTRTTGGAAASQGSGTSANANRSAAPQSSSVSLAVDSAPRPPAGATAITRPKEGRYSFMVMGAKPGESFPETAGLLSGELVYTVYLGIGTRPDWILQYCLPKAAPAAPGPLQPPYAYFMERPKVAFQSDDERVFVHGIIDFTGKFQQLAVVGDAVIGDKQTLLASLSLWQFRPAMRDGRPTAVEVLLIIPRPQL